MRLNGRLNILKGCKNDTQRNTTGYRNGYRNGRIELLKYILQIPDGACEATEAALKEREKSEQD